MAITASTCLLFLLLASCSALDKIGERPDPTSTLLARRTATLGGRISVWIVSPTAQFAPRNGTPSLVGTPRGELISQYATATAFANDFATQTAEAVVQQPNFQPGECPLPSRRVPDAPPDDFAAYPAAIGTFLSEGGPTAVLESELRIWGAITDQGGVVQDNTDLTGDGVEEVLITLFNPFTYNPDAILNAGQLLVYGCDSGGYRLIYQTPNSPGLALPVMHRVGDMNGDVKAELVFDIQSCSRTACIREGYILTWNPITGVFEPLNNSTIMAVNGRLGVVDLDNDGILELTAASNPPSDVASGPQRSVVDIWDWTGKNYVAAIRQPADPRYRIHALQDAEEALQQQSWQRALTSYRDVRNNEEYLSWTIPGEREILRAFATYRLVTIYARLRDGRAESALQTLLSESPEGTPGAVYAAMGQAFMDSFRATSNVNAACQAALTVASTRTEALAVLNSYGYANPVFSLNDLCPF